MLINGVYEWQLMSPVTAKPFSTRPLPVGDDFLKREYINDCPGVYRQLLLEYQAGGSAMGRTNCFIRQN